MRQAPRFLLALALLLAVPARVRAATPDAKLEEIGKAVLEDGNYKVRVQAALVLGKLADPRAVPWLVKALADANKTVRGIAAQALGQLGDAGATDPLRDLLKHESDPFVRGQAEKAIATLSASAGKRAKFYLSFGPFTGGVKSAGPEAAKIIVDALARDLGKLPVVTLSLSAADQHNFAKTGLVGFYIDGNITGSTRASRPAPRRPTAT